MVLPPCCPCPAVAAAGAGWCNGQGQDRLAGAPGRRSSPAALLLLLRSVRPSPCCCRPGQARQRHPPWAEQDQHPPALAQSPAGTKADPPGKSWKDAPPLLILMKTKGHHGRESVVLPWEKTTGPPGGIAAACD